MAYSILIIEDEQEIADNVQYALSSEGLSPIWVANGGDAKHTLQEQQIDLCILDVGLPDCSGFELLKDIRKTSNVPVLMLTARDEEIDRIVGLEIGADDYVSKPFSPREVVARVKAILKRSTVDHKEVSNTDTQTLDTSKTSSGFQHDENACKMSYQGNKLDLTRSEYVLLETFLSQPGRVFSRRQLIETVWSSQHPSDDRVIDTHIKTLRAKLKTHNPHTDFIITHRGFGYSLEL